MQLPTLDLAMLRAQTLGADAPIRTPFGERLLVYADYTASGRCLGFVEDYCCGLATLYGNSHTEDSLTGHSMTHLLHEAEAAIKRALNAGPHGKVICCGNGSTGAIHKLQEILGVAIPPATLHFLRNSLGEEAVDAAREMQPVVFVGPYEHHSNEVTWREGMVTVVEVELDAEGALDLAHLDRLLQDPKYEGRKLMGSFSAASNVTGLKSPVHEIARLLRGRGAIALFDYAASAPYVPIDMNPPGDPEGKLDAVFFSPHKFIGGPGSSGVLVFDEALYPKHLPPTVGGGGTVDYVGPQGHDFTADIEAREKAGTPGIFQVVRAALALEIKRELGIETIRKREHELLDHALSRWTNHERIEILGPTNPSKRIGIVSFNIADGEGGYLHPKLVTTLLNDLFGIQSRAGCSCAGPYGHRLLAIDEETSERYRSIIRKGHHGVKPGWCRVGLHYTMDDAEVAYVTDAVEFVADLGSCFIPLYNFDVETGYWTHKEVGMDLPDFSLTDALRAPKPTLSAKPEADRRILYAQALSEARALAESLPHTACDAKLEGELGELQFFALAER